MSEQINKYKSFFIVLFLSNLFSIHLIIEVYDNIKANLEKTGDEINPREIILEYIGYYIQNGGYSNFKFSRTIKSSDIYLIKFATESLISKHFIKNLKHEIMNIFETIKTNKKPFFGGNEKHDNLEKYFRSEIEYKNLKNIEGFEGNKNNNHQPDICVTVMPIGIMYSNNIDELINKSIMVAKLTHNNVVGILGAVISAYFTSLATSGVEIEKWIDMSIELMESKYIKNKLDLENTENMIDYVRFLHKFKRYRESRFNEGKIIKTKSNTNLIYKLRFHYTLLSDHESKLEVLNILACLISTYDALLECDGNYEKILYYLFFCFPGRTMHLSAFAGGLYGLLYGTNIPKNMLNYLEEKKIILDIDELSQKFGEFCEKLDV